MDIPFWIFLIIVIISAILLILLCIFVFTCLWIVGFTMTYRLLLPDDDDDIEYFPPSWIMVPGVIALALSRFEFRKIPDAVKEAYRLSNSYNSPGHLEVIRELE